MMLYQYLSKTVEQVVVAGRVLVQHFVPHGNQNLSVPSSVQSPTEILGDFSRLHTSQGSQRVVTRTSDRHSCTTPTPSQGESTNEAFCRW